jgi:mannose-6-phosphate isomerase-like protein (cupin superfamily)
MTASYTTLSPSAAILLEPGEGEILHVINDGIRVLADGAATGGSAFQFECLVPPGSGPPLHRHEREDELFFVVEGEFRFVLDGQESIASPGAFVYAPRESVHAFQNTSSQVGRLLVTCTPAGLDEAFRAVKRPDAGSNERSLPMDEIIETFARHGVMIEGPPLS